MKKSASANLVAILFFTILNACTRAAGDVNMPSMAPATSVANQTATIPPIETNQATPTEIPALSVLEANSRVLEYLQNGPNCILPCWLGIIPGLATLSDFQALMTKLRNVTTDSSYDIQAEDWSVSALTIPFPSDDKVIELHSAFLVQGNESTISAWAVTTRAYQLTNGEYAGDLFGYRGYNELLEAYTLPGILTVFGQPRYIYINAHLRTDIWPTTPGDGDNFRIHIWYPERGIFLKYTMEVEGAGGNYQICPMNSFMAGIFTPVQPGLEYQQLLMELRSEYVDFFPLSDSIKTPEEAFAMTGDEFTQLFSTPTDECLETPISLWWP